MADTIDCSHVESTVWFNGQMRRLLLTACWLLIASTAFAQGLTVAAASDLQTVMPEIASRFEKATGQPVRTSFGSSGNFFNQIQNGAPFDVFLSADIEYPRRLVASGHAEKDTLLAYARGRIVLWTRTDSGIDVRPGLAVVSGERVRRIAVANPEVAPYGRAAVAALRHEQLYERVRPKLIIGENISQATQFAQSGSTDVGIVALSLARSAALKNAGTYFEIPESFHPPIEQAAVVLAGSRQKELAHRFVSFLKTPEIVQLLETDGFSVPGR
jgi:molybdate transport system substrate-binding protein